MGFFSAIDELIRRLETIPDALYECVEYNKDELLQLRKDEMLLGRDSEGHPFTPGYTEDPYFKTKAQANAYANYKYGLEATHEAQIRHALNYPNKDDNTPNLRLTRDRYNSLSFQDQMFIVVNKEDFLINSTFREARLIDAKYHNKVFPLGPLAKEWFWNNILLQWLDNHIHGK